MNGIETLNKAACECSGTHLQPVPERESTAGGAVGPRVFNAARGLPARLRSGPHVSLERLLAILKSFNLTHSQLTLKLHHMALYFYTPVDC